MVHKVTLIPGDGIGPEVSAAAVRVLEATGVNLEWESFAAGADAFENTGIATRMLEKYRNITTG